MRRCVVLASISGALAAAVACSSDYTAATSEVPADAGEAGADAGRWCDDPMRGTFALCADFDDGPAEMGWTSSDRKDAISETIATDFRSPPRALRQRHERILVDGGTALLDLKFSTGVTSAGIRVAFDARVNINDSPQGIHEEIISFASTEIGGPSCALSATGVSCFKFGAVDVTTPLALPATLATWHHWEMTVTFGAGADGGVETTVAVTRDGARAVDDVHAAFDLRPSLQVILGPGVIGADHDWEVLYDDVLVQPL